MLMKKRLEVCLSDSRVETELFAKGITLMDTPLITEEIIRILMRFLELMEELGREKKLRSLIEAENQLLKTRLAK